MPKRVYTRAYASVRIVAPDLDPIQITSSLHLPPDIQYRRGEPRIERSSKGIVQENGIYSLGLWSMSSEKWVDSPQLKTHLEWLLNELEPHTDAILSLNISGLKVDFFCYSVGTTPLAPSLPRSIIERAERLNIAINIDHYHMANDKSVT